MESFSENPAPELPFSSLRVEIEFDRACHYDWHLLIGLRGAFGYCIDRMPVGVRDLLIRAFHEDSDHPSPFRLKLVKPDLGSCATIRLFCFGNESERMLGFFAQALNGFTASLKINKNAVPFKVKSAQREIASQVQLPFPEGRMLTAPEAGFVEELSHLRAVRIVSTSPLFSKSDPKFVFESGKWVELLVMRYADLLGVRRKPLLQQVTLLPLSGKVIPFEGRLKFSGHLLTRHGCVLDIRIDNTDPILLLWIRLLVILGLGRHTAHGAGGFEILLPEI